MRVFVEQSKISEREYRANLVKKLAYKLDWSLFASTVTSMGQPGLPDTLEEGWLENEENLKTLHNILFQFDIIEGKLVCPNCERIYPIKEGIPNLILDEDEI